jgi:hypothetical protein
VGGIIGLVSAETVVNALGTHCRTVAEVYGLCRPHSVGMQSAVLVYAGFVVAGALLGSLLRLP